MIKKLFLNKIFIFLLLLSSITIFSQVYARIHTPIDDFVAFVNSIDPESEEFAAIPVEADVIRSILYTLKSPYLQVTFNVTYVIFSLFISSLVFMVTVRKDERLVLPEHKTSYNEIVDLLYLTLYVSCFKFLFNTVYALLAGELITYKLIPSTILNFFYFVVPFIILVRGLANQYRQLKITKAACYIFSTLYLAILLVAAFEWR